MRNQPTELFLDHIGKHVSLNCNCENDYTPENHIIDYAYMYVFLIW